MIVTKSIAERVKAVPILSVVSARLLELLGDDNHSIHEVVMIVENDISLTTKILKAANSAAFSPRVPITTIASAVNNIGEKVIMGIAIESCSGPVFKKALDGYESAEGELWDHSLCAAIGARVLASYTKNEVSPNLAFTAGLLHDIGKSVISELLKGNTQELIAQFDDGQADSFLTIEQTIAGIDHAELGYELALHWKLPEALATVIRHHHQPIQADEKYRDLVYTVHLGDIIAMMAGIGTGADSMAYRIAEDYTDYLDIDDNQLSNVVIDVQDEFIKTKSAIFGETE